MKKLISLVLGAILMFSVTGYAAESYATPFERNTLGCGEYRIPALLTLADGSVCASADMRWDHGKDSPQNIETVFASSADGYGNWEYVVVNRFDDYADGAGSANSASFIDSALLQSRSGRLFLLTEAYMSGVGIMNTKKGSGCVERNGKRYLSLAKRGESDFCYYISDFGNGYAPVFKNGEPTGYSVDEEYRLYKNSEALTLPQLDADEKPTGADVPQSVFYADSELHVFETPYLWLRTSDDSGRTWSSPTILNPQVTSDDDYFLGAAPGRGLAVTVDGGERLLFCLYKSNAGGGERAVTIYSEDGGATWNRGKEVENSAFTRKTSESQLVSLPDGTIRMFSRNMSDYTAFCDSSDAGASFTKSRACPDTYGTKNCMVSFINYSHRINGRDIIVSSSGGSAKERADGVVRVFAVRDGNSFEMLSEYHVNDGFYAYSCLTELRDGKLALLYEDEASHINYMILAVDEAGGLSEINGNDIQYNKKERILQRIKRFLYRILFSVVRFFIR